MTLHSVILTVKLSLFFSGNVHLIEGRLKKKPWYSMILIFWAGPFCFFVLLTQVQSGRKINISEVFENVIWPYPTKAVIILCPLEFVWRCQLLWSITNFTLSQILQIFFWRRLLDMYSYSLILNMMHSLFIALYTHLFTYKLWKDFDMWVFNFI